MILYHSKQVWCQALSPCVQSLEIVRLDITGNEWPTPRRGPRKQSLQEDAVVRFSSKWQHGAAERRRAAWAVFSESNSRSWSRNVRFVLSAFARSKGSALWSLLCVFNLFSRSFINFPDFMPLPRLFLMHCCTDCPFQLRDSRMLSRCAAVAWFSKCPETFIETVFECHPLKYSLPPTPLLPCCQISHRFSPDISAPSS